MNQSIRSVFNALSGIPRQLTQLTSRIEHLVSHQTGGRPYYYLGDHRALTSLYTGAPFIVDTRDVSIATWIIRDGRWEAFVESVILEHCSSGNVVIDCGAHFGYYSVMMSSRIGTGGRIYSFEPNPTVFAVLRDNIHINGLDGITTVCNCALGARAAHATMYFQHNFSGGGFLTKDLEFQGPAGFECTEVEVKRLDQVLPADVEVDFMKVDVEGSEPEVFDGAWAVIDRSPNLKMMVELSPSEWSQRKFDPVSFLQCFKDRGFRLDLVVHEGVIKNLDPQDLVRRAEQLGYIAMFLATRA